MKIIKIVCTVFLVFSVLTVTPRQILAYSRYAGPPFCDQPTGVGAPFYDFDRIVIYYDSFPSKEDEGKTHFPPALKFEKFNKFLLDKIKNRFLKCLKTEKGEDKPIIVVPPKPLMEESALSEEKKEDKWLRLINKNGTLVIIMYVAYIELGENEYVSVSYIMHRPGMDGEEALPIGARYGSWQYFPKSWETDRFEDGLSSFFGKISPKR